MGYQFYTVEITYFGVRELIIYFNYNTSQRECGRSKDLLFVGKFHTLFACSSIFVQVLTVLYILFPSLARFNAGCYTCESLVSCDGGLS